MSSKLKMTKSGVPSESSVSHGSNAFDSKDVKVYLEKAKNKMKKAFDSELKNVTPIVFEEAIEFLKKESESLVKYMTQ